MSSVRVAAGLAERRSARAAAPAPARRGVEDRPDLRVVRPGRTGPRVGLVVALASIALFASLLGLAVFHTMLVQSQSTLDELDGEIRQAEDRVEDLRVEITEAEAPEHILEKAEDLGMVPAGDVVVLDARETDEG